MMVQLFSLSEKISITKPGKCHKSMPLAQRTNGEVSVSTALGKSTGYARGHVRPHLQDAQATARPCGRDSIPETSDVHSYIQAMAF